MLVFQVATAQLVTLCGYEKQQYRVFASLSVNIRWRIRQVEVVVDVICHFVRDVDRGVVHVKVLVEGFNVHLLPLVLQLLDRLSILVCRVLLIQVLLTFLILCSLMFLYSKICHNKISYIIQV